MVLFISDIHFGLGGRREESTKEAELIACLRAREHEVTGLFLVGDVFDQYIEYKHLVPKGFVRFQSLLAEWTDRNVPVTYIVGNHDPWHQQYFEQELGLRLVYDLIIEPLFGKVVHIKHGDGIGNTSPLYNRLKPLLRHPVPVGLYRALLPGDIGFGLARWVNLRFNEKINDELVVQLRDHARNILVETAADVVVMGHCHHAGIYHWPEGHYLNPGSWHHSRTFGRLEKKGLRLLSWNGTCSSELQSHHT